MSTVLAAPPVGPLAFARVVHGANDCRVVASQCSKSFNSWGLLRVVRVHYCTIISGNGGGGGGGGGGPDGPGVVVLVLVVVAVVVVVAVWWTGRLASRGSPGGP